MITEDQFIDSAKMLKVEPAIIKAVAQVEGGRNGISNGRPIILFEPHVFLKQLREVKITPVVSDICYPVWGTNPYPAGQGAQWERMERATKINRTAALQSASWGMFQIMGYNWAKTGCVSLQAFVNAMYESEGKQLELFVNYIKRTNLDDELQNRDWKGFARQYNGALYYKNEYDVKLRSAYYKFKS